MDVSRGMKRTYEYYLVDPSTWLDVRRVYGVTGGSATWDLDDELGGSATFRLDASEDLDDEYLRVYMVVEQDGARERIPVGTWLLECPEDQFDGTRSSVEAKGYPPLKELADCIMPPGYPCAGDAALRAAEVMESKSRLKVLAPASSERLDGVYKAGDEESALEFCRAMLAAASLRMLVDRMGRVTFAPVRDAAAMKPAWTFRDDDESVLLPEMSHRSGLRDVHNVARVVYSTVEGCIVGEAVNDDGSSPASLQRRGREVTLVETSPDLPENPTPSQVNALAEKLLREDSAYLNEFSFSHAFVPEVAVGCAVDLDYTRAKKKAIALVSAQAMEFDEAATVGCRATSTEQVWG